MKYYRLLVVLLVITTLICVKQGSCQGGVGLLCDSYKTDKGIFNGTETCENSDEICFVLWGEKTNERNETFQTVIRKGCFIVQASVQAKEGVCRQEDCIENPDYDAFKSEDVSGFCCCNVNMCNKNFTPVYYTEHESTVAPLPTTGVPTRGDSDKTVTVVIALVICAVLAVIMTIGVIYKYKLKCHTTKYTATGAEEKELPDLPLDISV